MPNLVIPIESLTQQEQEDLRYLIRDAMWDFQRSRKGNYVEKCYPEFTQTEKDKKVQQVARRVALAEKLQRAAYDLRIE